LRPYFLDELADAVVPLALAFGAFDASLNNGKSSLPSL